MSAVTAIPESLEVSVSQISDLKARQAELKTLQRAVKDRAATEAWETKVLVRNPNYQVGSVRAATDLDREQLGHCHGKVCTIKCQVCGSERTVNVQDAFQVKFCGECRKQAGREAAKEKRAAKKLAGISREDIERQIAELNKALTRVA